ncbi:hypothetical protein [Leptolyngbya sp. BC1307]|uniref:hypothetical protein n=1 Tax=Leptolyngbya sp. BC1307 TaxID=2029589 RepID=UPI000EFB89C7|nr:hypothetical protein [Leptolyngbya sp. BC1307]
MTPKEELMQAIQTSPDDIISALLETLKKLRGQSESAAESAAESAVESAVESAAENPLTERLYRKNGILVAETGPLSDFDTTAFIRQMREERIQSQIDKLGL